MNHLTPCSSKLILSSSLLLQTDSNSRLSFTGTDAAFLLQGEALEMQHGAQRGCQRFTTRQTGAAAGNARTSSYTKTCTFRLYTFNRVLQTPQDKL